LFLILVVGETRLVSAQGDPSLQFSPVANPNGDWKYGYENFPLPNPFNLLTMPGAVGGLDYWQAPAFGQVAVYHNPNSAAVTFTTLGDNAIYQPGELGMHPGPNDQYAIVQFSAPTNGDYIIHGTFEGLDIGGTNTQVDLLWNNSIVASGNVVGFGTGSDVPLSFGPVLLNVGDTLAFAVGGNPFQGSTGLLNGASVDAVSAPEPQSLVLLSIAIVSAAIYNMMPYAKEYFEAKRV
jgi:hypothetical protein